MLSETLRTLIDLAEPVESITTMERAAESRLLDAVAIAVERPGEALGCAYLLGYVVECTLKAAWARLSGLGLADDLYTNLVRRGLGGSGHDHLLLLERCLVARGRRLPPLSVEEESLWRERVRDVAGAVDVTFRYKSMAVPARWLGPMYDDVEWIVLHASDLWSPHAR